MRGALEVRSEMLKRLVGTRDVKHIAPVALMALITYNHLRGE